MGTGFNKRKKQAKAMQEQMMQLQSQVKDIEVVGSAGNGLVEITLNGDNELKKIKIKPDCVDPEDVEGLEDLIAAAHRDAHSKVKEQSSGMMGPLGGLGL
jgi:DNA-binding YbaB/EbfC family protein